MKTKDTFNDKQNLAGQRYGADGGWDWNNLDEDLEGLGSVLAGIAGIVGASNNSNHTTTTNVNTNTRNDQSLTLSKLNGTTLTAIILGAVALIIVLVIVLGRK